MSKKDRLIKKNLITLLKVFENKPNLLAQYLLEYDILDDKMKKLLLDNKELFNLSKELDDSMEIKIPYFNTIEEIEFFYSKFFNNINGTLSKESSEEIFNQQLKTYLINEEYEKAAKLRDYCMKNNIFLR